MSFYEKIPNIKDAINLLKSKDDNEKIGYVKDDETIKEEDYRIAICQDGKFAVTFDTGNLRIKVLENTDHRKLRTLDDKRKVESDKSDKIDKIDKTIAYFKINDDFTINKFYKNDFIPTLFSETQKLNVISDNVGDSLDSSNVITIVNNESTSKKDQTNHTFRWSFDISNMHKRNNNYFILVAISHIDVDEDMKDTKNNSNKDYYCKREYLIKKKFTPNKEENHETNVPVLPEESEKNNETKKGIAVYRLELKKEKENYDLVDVTCYSSNNISGICDFIEILDVDESESQRRFIILNFHGIYNFEFNYHFDLFNLNEKFDYPIRIRRELDNWYTDTNDDCMKRLLSGIYDKYFLVTQYKNDVQSLEVYDLAKMELETSAKKVENKDIFVKQYNYDTFSVSRLQFCFTRGNNFIRLYYMENGLQVASKRFNEIKSIYLLEFFDSDEKLLIIGRGLTEGNKGLKFIIWDLYNTGKVESISLDYFPNIEYLGTRLARTSGNILRVDNKGIVTSVLREVENKLSEQKKQKQKEKEEKKSELNKTVTIKNEYPDIRHTLYSVNQTFEPIVIEKEPWVLGDYERNSYCLYQNKKGTETETLQLIVGRSTVQIWHQINDENNQKEYLPNKGEPFLEYIWTNRIPINQEREETKLRIEKFEFGIDDGQDDRLNDFSLKIYWYIRKEKKENGAKKKLNTKEEKELIKKENDEIDKLENGNLESGEFVEKRRKIIKRKDIIEKFHAIRHACKALEHINKRYKSKYLVDNYIKVHQKIKLLIFLSNYCNKYEEMVTYIKHIVWRFAKHDPENFTLLDVRYNVMKSLIIGDCDHLIKYILFGVEEDIENKDICKEKESKEKGKKEKRQKEFETRHIPRNKIWPDEKFIKDDDLDFERKNNELEDNEKIVPSNNMELAIYHCKGRELKDTIIVAYLLEYYSRHATDCADDYARKLFFKECFADQGHFSAQDPDDIIPKVYQSRRNHDIKFRAFRPITELKSNKYIKWYDRIWHLFKSFNNNISKYFEDFDNDLGKSPLALRVVPLPGFTIDNIPREKVEYDFKKFLLNIFLFIFIPRGYKIGRGDRKLLSPFSRVVLYENNDDIYDNPATEAVIDFRWQEAKNFFFFLFFRFLVFAVSFVLVSWAYLNHVMSMMHKNYFQFSDGFGSVNAVDTGLLVGISFSIFILWIELIFYLRLIPNIGIYIYYIVIIFKTIFPFFLFMLIVILAFAHTMFVLLRDPKNIKTKNSTLSGFATNALTKETLNIELTSNFDPKSSDNPFSSFLTAIEAVYFWISGNWVQKDEFDFWAIDVFTLIASIFLVVILQNMLIAFMSGVYERAETKGRQTLLRYRANYIADYEALHHIHFWRPEPEPKHIYYFGQSKNFEEWYKSRKYDRGAIYKDFEEKSTFTRRIFKQEDYDKVSVWKYDDNIKANIKAEVQKIKIMKNDMNNSIEYLIKKLNDLKNEENKNDIDKKIEEIKETKELYDTKNFDNIKF
ncbi:hypothetical protein C1645_858515 [Glomus cerebriforme]|uniref:Ion transport domain-containing protein n=1 Tax=Glomus cerebriforme TaxID=658196 RepID=A0A397SFA8_9GLOM|nr:hypothetical protein C1645_858515 [Glomus cerebriforme]